MELTNENYHSDNKYLSNSKINDYITCPHYFKRKHIDKDLEITGTASLKIGSAVDTVLTKGVAEFNKQYQIKVLKRDNPELFEEQKENINNVEFVSQSEIDKVLEIVKAVKRTDAYKGIENHDKQVVLKHNCEGMGIWAGLKGMLDFLKIDGDKAVITDLKTSVDISSKKYYYKCEDFGYFRQMAFYKMLVLKLYPKVESVICQHIVVENSQPYRVQTFKFDNQRLHEEEKNLMHFIDKIIDDNDFAPSNPDWEKAILLGDKSK